MTLRGVSALLPAREVAADLVDAEHAAPAALGRLLRLRQERHLVVDVEHARRVLGALHVAGHPEQVIGGARQHAHASRIQVSLVPPPCEELTTSEPCLQRDAGQPARHHLHRLAREHERAQVDVARRDAALDEGRAGRERERRLRDVALGVGLDRGAERLDLGRGRRRADQHAVAARAVHFLDDQLAQMGEDVGEVVGVAADVGRHVVQDRLLAEVELDHLRHERIDRLVVGDAGADRVRERHVAGAVGAEQARAAERRVGAERERVEEVVVDAAVDHVDALGALRRAHVDEVVLDEQVLPLDQLDAHLLGEECMLEVRAVVHAGRQHDDGRIVDRRRRDRAQRLEQEVGVVRDRRDAVAAEELREEPHHHLAVLEHVRDPARNAQVVLEHVVAAAAVGVGGAHDVDAGDVRVDVAGHLDALHLGAVLRVAEHLVGRDDARLEDLLVVIDVVEEAVQRRDALAQTPLHHAPLVGRDDARDEVERDQPLGAAVRAAVVLGAVDRERDADAAKDDLGFLAPRPHHLRRLFLQPTIVAAVVLAHRAVRVVHFVEAGRHPVSEGSKVRAKPWRAA